MSLQRPSAHVWAAALDQVVVMVSLQIAAVQDHVCGFLALLFALQVMIVVGGQAPKAIRSVECYDFEEERWDQVAELPSRRCRAGKGNFYCNLLCFPDAPLQHWVHD